MAIRKRLRVDDVKDGTQPAPAEFGEQRVGVDDRSRALR